MKQIRDRMRMLPKVVTTTCIMVILLGFSAGSATAAKDFVKFGGSNPGGAWFTIAGGLAPLYNEKISNINVTPVATGASVDNNRQIRKGDLDIILSHSTHAYDNWNGTGVFEKDGPFKGLRMLCGVFIGWNHWVTLADSDIKTMSDFAGKKIGLGPPGSGNAATSENILKDLGLMDKIKPVHLNFGDTGRALAEGHLDAIGVSTAPMPNVVEVEAMHKIRLVEMNSDEIDMVLEKSPARFISTKIPAGTYKSWGTDYPCVGFQVYMAASEKVSPEVVYNILKVTFDPENKTQVENIHKTLKQLSAGLTSMTSIKVPLHAGAVKFWEEQGFDIPGELIPPEMK